MPMEAGFSARQKLALWLPRPEDFWLNSSIGAWQTRCAVRMNLVRCFLGWMTVQTKVQWGGAINKSSVLDLGGHVTCSSSMLAMTSSSKNQ
jgi:hypothetical protein